MPFTGSCPPIRQFFYEDLLGGVRCRLPNGHYRVIRFRMLNCRFTPEWTRHKVPDYKFLFPLEEPPAILAGGPAKRRAAGGLGGGNTPHHGGALMVVEI